MFSIAATIKHNGLVTTISSSTVDPLAAYTYDLRLQTHRGDNVPLGLYKDTSCTIPATIAGDLISAWRDEISGGARKYIQATEALRPSLQFTGAGAPVVRFDGLTNYLEIETPFAFAIPCTVSGVAKLTDVGYYPQLYSNLGTRTMELRWGTNEGKIEVEDSPFGGSSLNTWIVAQGEFGVSDQTCYQDGSAAPTASKTGSGSTTSYIGGRGASLFFQGDMSAVMVSTTRIDNTLLDFLKGS